MSRELLRLRTLAAFNSTFMAISEKLGGKAFDDLDDEERDAVAYFVVTGLIAWLACERAPGRATELHIRHGEAVSQACAPCFQVGANER